MENGTGLISYRISTLVPICSSDPAFWGIVHEHGVEVDRLPGYDHDRLNCLVDWLASELRILFLSTDRVACCRGTWNLGLFDRHDLNVLRTRLKKRPIADPESVFEAYDSSMSKSPVDGDWLEFLSRQSAHLHSCDDKLLIVCVEENVHYTV